VYVPEYRRNPYQSDDVRKLYEEMRTVGYFAVLFHSRALPAEDRAIGNWVGLYKSMTGASNPGPDASDRYGRRPLIWDITGKYRIGGGTGNGGATAHNSQFEVRALGHEELYAIEHNVFADGRLFKTPRIERNCLKCKQSDAAHANGKCLFYPTLFQPLFFEAYWWFPQHLPADERVTDRMGTIRKYAGHFLTW
jgi:hypothetical protein